MNANYIACKEARRQNSPSATRKQPTNVKVKYYYDAPWLFEIKVNRNDVVSQLLELFKSQEKAIALLMK